MITDMIEQTTNYSKAIAEQVAQLAKPTKPTESKNFTYLTACANATELGKPIYNSEIAYRSAYKLLRGYGLSRVDEAAKEIAQSAVIRWIKKNGAIHPMSIIRRTCQKFLERESLRVCQTYDPLQDDRTTDDQEDNNPPILPSLPLLLRYSKPQDRDILCMLYNGLNHAQIMDSLNMARSTYFYRLASIRKSTKIALDTLTHDDAYPIATSVTYGN